MARFFEEEFRLCLPFLPDELCWLGGLEPSGVVEGVEEQIKLSARLLVVIVEIPLDGGSLDRSVHALDLTIRPRVVGRRSGGLDAGRVHR